MSRLNDFETLLKDLQGIDAASAKAAFTALFEKGCTLLEFDDDQAAKAFDTSRPNASRWRRGKVVPPAAGLVLRFMRDQVEAKVKTLKRMEAQRVASIGGGGGYAPPNTAMAAKGR